MRDHPLFAAVYDRLTLPAEAAGLADRRRRLLSAAHGRVLEVGAGTGHNLPHYQPGDVDSVTLIEPDGAMRRHLAERLSTCAVPLEVIPDTIEDARLPEGSFDSVVCTLVLCTVPDLDAAMGRIRSLLAPDGQLLFLEHVRASGGRGRVQRAVTPLWKRAVPGCHLDRDPISAMRRAGFLVTDCERFQLPLGNTLVGAAVQGAARRPQDGSVSGTLALVGGAEWRDGCDFDADLLAASGGTEVLVLPTAAAYENPDKAVQTATKWFEKIGGQVRGLMVLGRPDAEEKSNVDAIAGARFIYLGGGSPLHLRSVLKESKAWEALVHAWQSGAVVAGSSAGAMVLGDPMVDPRGGAYTLGLGLVEQLAIVPHHDTWPQERAHRTMQLAPRGVPIAAVDERTALIRDEDGKWRAAGAGQVQVFLEGKPAGLDVLPG